MDDRKKDRHRGRGKDFSPAGGKPAAKRPGRARGEGRDLASSHPAKRWSASALTPPGPSGGKESGSERIARRLARAGVASRRDAEALIAAGRIRVNGAVLASPAFNVGPHDRIEIDGEAIPAIERTRLFLFHKPAGVVTTSRDPQGRRTVFDALPAGLPRLMTVGRLDINTEGLLLLTNDGGLARVLELPATGWLRRYRVRVHGKVDPDALAALRGGVSVDGVFYGSIEAALDREQGTNAWLTIGLREGKNREVKNILGTLGLDVTRLIRVSYGPFQLAELAEGELRELKGRHLRDQLGARLIAEAGADFDAPLAQPFSGKPARAGREEGPRRPSRSAQPRIEEGGLIRNRKRTRERQREEALDRLQTERPSRFGKKQYEEKRQEKPSRPRSSNVWMAPGARPTGQAGGRLTNGTGPSKGESAASSPSRLRRNASSPLRRGEDKPRSAPVLSPAERGKGGSRNEPEGETDSGRAPKRKMGKPADRTPHPASGRPLPPRGREKSRTPPKKR